MLGYAQNKNSCNRKLFFVLKLIYKKTSQELWYLKVTKIFKFEYVYCLKIHKH